MAQRPGDLVADRYRLGRQIGSGGMAKVFEAFDVTLNRRVAAKFLVAESRHQGTIERRFLREARIAAAVRHAHVVEVFDFGVADKAPFMIMELLEGTSLAERALEPPLMTLKELFDVLEGVLKGLGAVHRAGIVHRDVKPENIFLARGDTHEVSPKIFDFGVSRIQTREGSISASTTVEGYLVGTPHYMSAEQARGKKDLDARTDVYSIGVVLYEYLTGTLPFDAELMGDLVIAIATDHPKSVFECRPELGRPLSDLVEKAMSKLPSERYETAEEMRQELAAIREEMPELDALKCRLVLRVGGDSLNESLDEQAQVPLPWDPQPLDMDYALPEELGNSEAPPAMPAVPTVVDEGAIVGGSVHSSSPPSGPTFSRRPRWPSVVALSALPLAMVAAAVIWLGAFSGPDEVAATDPVDGPPSTDPAPGPPPGQTGTVETAPEPTTAEPTDITPTTVAPSNTDPTPAPESESRRVTVRLRGVPEGATVSLDGSPVSGSELEVRRGRTRHQLRVEAEGMQPFEMAFAADSDRRVQVQMTPVSRIADGNEPTADSQEPSGEGGSRGGRRGRRGRSAPDDSTPSEGSGRRGGIFRSPDF